MTNNDQLGDFHPEEDIALTNDFLRRELKKALDKLKKMQTKAKKKKPQLVFTIKMEYEYDGYHGYEPRTRQGLEQDRFRCRKHRTYAVIAKDVGTALAEVKKKGAPRGRITSLTSTNVYDLME
jgi:hypothetical protein